MHKVMSSGIIAIGASAGGAPVIEQILADLKPSLPGILIVIHMPGGFTASYAERLNKHSAIDVKEAEHGDIICNGCAYVAPGGKHMVVYRKENYCTIEINFDKVVNGFRPSVDVLFDSVARCKSFKKTGIILSGMGSDGVRGLSAIKEAGGVTWAQSESSSAVFGMPRMALESRAAMNSGDVDEIVSFLNGLAKD